MAPTTQSPGTTKSNGKSKAGPKGKKNTELEDYVRALGGNDDDLELLKGMRDEHLVQGAGHEDQDLQNDVSKFLKELKGGKKFRSKSETDMKTKSEKVTLPTDKPARKMKKQKTKAEVNIPEHSGKASVPTPTITGLTLNNNQGKLVFQPNAHWYSAAPPLPGVQKALPLPSTAQITTFTDRAVTLFNTDAAAYQASSAFTGKSTSDTHFLNAILSKGTLSDRLSALTLLVQSSPVHNTKALDTLRSMAERGRGKGGRDEGLKAMRCIVDWWVGGGAPARKLRYFRDQPLLHPSVTDQYLIVWYFEDWLKKYFYSVLQILETYSLDPLPYVRTQALSFITTFLREKPEQEQNLLRLLVNKLGDTEKSVCSRASYHLLQVLQSHPAMKAVIVREVRSLVFRPTASASSVTTKETESKQNSHVRFANDDEKPAHAKGKTKSKSHGEANSHTMERWNSHSWYYSSVTLNQIVLTPSEQDRDVARTLIDLYFEMFREILGGTVGSKLDDEEVEEVGNKHQNTQTGRDLQKTKGKSKAVRGDAGFVEVEDANSRLVSAVLTGVNRALPFAKVDMGNGDELFKKHIDTLFLITHTSTFNISLQALMLILQVVTNLPAAAPSTSKDGTTPFFTTLTDRFYRTLYSSLSDQRLGTSNKQAMYLNLLFKAVKSDLNIERVKAFIRRFIQILVVGTGGSGGVEFVTGGLYMLGELFSTVSGLRAMFSDPARQESKESEAYDPRKRDPQYAHASSSPLYEILPLLHHYHPAVSLHARQLLSSQPVTATADLSLNTLSHFLDRFVFKNPKKPKTKGASVMQPAASGVDGAGGVKLMKGEVINGEAPVNEEKFRKRRAEDIPVDELFFHRFFTRKNEKERVMADKVKKRKSKGDVSESGSEVESAGEEEEEPKEPTEGQSHEEEEDSDKEESDIWEAMKATMPAELQDDDLFDDDDNDDDDDLSSGLDDDSDAEGGEEDELENRSDAEAASGRIDHEDGEDDDALSLVEASDNEDLLSLNEEVPDGLIDFEVPDSGSDGEWDGIGESTDTKKRKRSRAEDKKKRKKLRSLPTFASYEDYAKMIEDAPEDNI